jgi:hypothetical protein
MVEYGALYLVSFGGNGFDNLLLTHTMKAII